MYEEKIVLCGANSYDRKFYLNPDFEALPDSIKDELKIMCVLYTEDVGGILTLVFEEDGELMFEVTTEDNDLLFDEIGSHLKIKELQRTKKELLESLQLYYRVFFLGEEVPRVLFTSTKDFFHCSAFLLSSVLSLVAWRSFTVTLSFIPIWTAPVISC